VHSFADECLRFLKLSREVVSLKFNGTVASAAKKMAEGGFGCLLVTRKGSVKSIVAERNLEGRYLRRISNQIISN